MKPLALDAGPVDLVDHLQPVGLDELVATADLQTRKDRKYLVPSADLPGLVAALDEGRVLTIDDRTRFAYRSVYFDTPRLDAYLDAAHRRPSRFKVRTRRYVDTGLCMLEVKTRDRRGRTVKHRAACEPGEENGLTGEARAFVRTIDETRPVANELGVTLTTTYHRTTLLLDDTHPARVTIDTGLIWEGADARLPLGRLALIETKTGGRPSAFDHILWRAGHRPTTISKYCTGLAALHPGLPANKWNRVLRHHLDWRPLRP